MEASAQGKSGESPGEIENPGEHRVPGRSKPPPGGNELSRGERP
jgi:hypothetical protein